MGADPDIFSDYHRLCDHPLVIGNGLEIIGIVTVVAGPNLHIAGKDGAAPVVLGFTSVFVALGALASTLGGLLRTHQTAVNIVSGLIVILFGLSYLGLLNLHLFRGSRHTVAQSNMRFFSALLFGIIFSVGWTPCVGAFLGSALMLASQQGHILTGMGMLLCYSLGLGIPFLFSAVLIDKLKSTFNFIKQHYSIINKLCGGLLILIGILMATGTLGHLLTLLS